jgi:hypothetical protein
VLEQVREGADPRLPLELALVRVCRPAADLSLDALEQRISALEARGGGGAPAPPPAPAKAESPAAAPPGPPDPPPEPPPPSPSTAAVRAPDLEQLTATWNDAIVPEIGRRSVPLQSLMQHASPRALGGGEVVLAFPRSQQFALTTADSDTNREVLEEVLGQAVGSPVRVRLEVASADAEPEAPAAGEAREPIDENDLLTELKEKFDAREIEERR